MGYYYPGERVDLGGNRGWTDRDAAESIWRIDKVLGHLLQITEAGRTWDQQNAHWNTYLRNGWPIALNPDTPSEHQKGKAIDSNEAQRNQALMERAGFRRTVYRWVNGVWTLVEQWHYEYFAHLDLLRDEIAKEEEFLMSLSDNEQQQMKADIAEIKGWLRGDQKDVDRLTELTPAIRELYARVRGPKAFVDMLQDILGQIAAVRYAQETGQQLSPEEIAEKLAPLLAPYLVQNMAKLADADVEQIASVAVAENEARAAKKLEEAQ